MPNRDCHTQCPSALVCQYALPVFECHILCPSVPVCPACIWALGLVLWKALYRRPGQPRRFVQLKIFLALFCLTFFKLTHTTGRSKETVDCNFLLTDPKISKSVKTQWFLGSLYREVLVFWCLKNARCVEFCLSEIFQYKASCTKNGLNTQMLPRRNPNLKQVHKQLSDTLWEAPQTPFSQL